MTSESSDSNPALSEVIAAYLNAMATGSAPERAALLAAHPELADDLRAFFADHDKMTQAAAPVRAALAAEPFPQTFGAYELLEEIGRGGMGIVYRARQVSSHQVVALKRIRAGQLASAEEVARFRRETEAAAALDHPHIVPIVEVGEHERQPYFTMKLVEGGNLNAHLDRFHRDARATARLLTAVAGAVHHAHQRGVLHRDLKPANILIDDKGQPHVTDFGLAKRLEEEGKLTRSGAIVGTPEYMAPEQARGDKGVTTAVDIYGVGAVLYFLLTRRPPFQGDYDWEILKQVVEEDPAPPRGLNRQASRDLEAVCLQCLRKDPNRRYGSANDLAQDLKRCGIGLLPTARHATTAERLAKWVRKHPARASLVVMTALLVLSSVFFTWRLRQEIGVVRKQQQELTSRGAKLTQLQDDVALTGKKFEGALQEAGAMTAKAARFVRDHQRTRMVLQLQKVSRLGRDDPFAALHLLQDNERCPPDLRGSDWHLLHNAAQGPTDFACFRGDGWWGDWESIGRVEKSPDGKHLVRVGQRVVDGQTLGWTELLDVQTGKAKVLRQWPQFDKEGKARAGQPRLAAFHPGGRWLAVAYLVFVEGAKNEKNTWVQTVEVLDLTADKNEPVQTLRGSSELPWSMTFDPQGRFLAVAFWGGAVLCWETATWKEHKLPQRKFAVDPMWINRFGWTTLAFSADGNRLASATFLPDEADAKRFRPAGLRLSCWDLMRDDDPKILLVKTDIDVDRGLDIGDSALAFTPDGNHLIVANLDDNSREATRSAVHVLDAGSWQLRRTFALPNFMSGRRLAISPDGKDLALSGVKSHQPRVVLWDLARGREKTCFYAPDIFQYSPHGRKFDDPFLHLGFHADSARLTAYTREGQITWTVRGQGPRTLSLPENNLAVLALHPALTMLATPGPAHSVELRALPSGNLLHALTGHDEDVTCLAFSVDGAHLATGGKDQRVIVWNTATGEKVKTLEGHYTPVQQVLFTQDGKHVLGLRQPLHKDGNPRNHQWALLWEVASGKMVQCFDTDISGYPAMGKDLPCIEAPRTVAAEPATKELTFANDNEVQIYEPAIDHKFPFRHLRTLKHGFQSITYSAKGNRLSGFQTGRFKVLDMPEGKECLTISPFPRGTTYAALNADGSTAIFGTEEGALHFHDVQSPQEPVTVAAHEGAVRKLLLSADGNTLVSTGEDGLVKLWDVTPTRLRVSLPAKTELEFDPLARRLIAGEIPAGSSNPWARQLCNLDQWSHDVPPLLGAWPRKFSLEGRWLSTSSAAEPLTVWETATWKKVFTLPSENVAADVHPEPPRTRIAASLFSPDGKLLVYASGLYQQSFNKSEFVSPLTLRMVTLATGQVQDLPHDGSVVYSLEFNPESTLLCVQAGQFFLLDMQAQALLATMPPGEFSKVSWGTARRTFVLVNSIRGTDVNSTDHEIHSWAAEGGVKKATFPGWRRDREGNSEHHTPLLPVLPGGDSLNVFAVTHTESDRRQQGRVEQWNFRTGARKTLIAGEERLFRDQVSRCLLSPSGRWLAVSEDGLHEDDWEWGTLGRMARLKAAHIRLYDAESGERKASIPVDFVLGKGGRFTDTYTRFPRRFGPDEKTVFLGTHHDETDTTVGSIALFATWVPNLLLLDLEKQRPVSLPPNLALTPLIHPDGKLLVLTDAGVHATVTLWDRQADKLHATFAHPAPVAQAGFSVDGRRLVTTTVDGRTWVWDVYR